MEKPEAALARKSPRCNDCLHYYITHHASFPYGCRALGFKSQRQPSLVVREASGQPCLTFVPKKCAD